MNPLTVVPIETSEHANRIAIELDCPNATLRVTDTVGPVPMAVWDGHVARYQLGELDCAHANALLVDLEPFARLVIAGYERAFDGQRYVARFSELAEAALVSIEHVCAAAAERATVDHAIAQSLALQTIVMLPFDPAAISDLASRASVVSLDDEYECFSGEHGGRTWRVHVYTAQRRAS